MLSLHHRQRYAHHSAFLLGCVVGAAHHATQSLYNKHIFVCNSYDNNACLAKYWWYYIDVYLCSSSGFPFEQHYKIK